MFKTGDIVNLRSRVKSATIAGEGIFYQIEVGASGGVVVEGIPEEFLLKWDEKAYREKEKK